MDKTFCIFGESVTQAAYVKDGWVDLLKNYLEQKYANNFINVFNLGVGGNNSTDILKRFRAESSVRMPTTIIFAFGVNDSAYIWNVSKPITPEKIFASNLTELIELSAEFSRDITFISPVIGDDSVLKPFSGGNLGEEKSYDRKRLEDYCHILETVAESKDCKFIHLLDELIPDDFADGLHPNESGHRKMFEIIKNSF